MRNMRMPTWLVLLLLLTIPVSVLAQGRDCSMVVVSALEKTDLVCAGTGRNEACYGHLLLQADPQPGFESFKFDSAGDRIDVARLQTLRLSPMNVAQGTWGVALMKVQADIPDDQPRQNITMLLFGDVNVENSFRIPHLIDVTPASRRNINVRRDPDDDGFVLGTIKGDQTTVARGRTADGEWIYVDLLDGSGRGWVKARLVRGATDLEQLNVVNPHLKDFGPMQAFLLKTGSKQTECNEAPNDGVLIQTPEGVAQVRLWINEVKIRLGSTAFVQAQPDNKMVIKTIEGAAHIETMGVEQVAIAGTSVTIPIDNNLKPVAPPSAPRPYREQEVAHLPVNELERQITVAPPLDLTATAPLVTPTASSVDTTQPASATSVLVATDTAQPSATNTLTPVATDTDVPRPTDTEVPVVPTPTNAPSPSVIPTLEPTPVPADTLVPSSTSTPQVPTDLPTATLEVTNSAMP